MLRLELESKTSLFGRYRHSAFREKPGAMLFMGIDQVHGNQD